MKLSLPLNSLSLVSVSFGWLPRRRSVSRQPPLLSPLHSFSKVLFLPLCIYPLNPLSDLRSTPSLVPLCFGQLCLDLCCDGFRGWGCVLICRLGSFLLSIMVVVLGGLPPASPSCLRTPLFFSRHFGASVFPVMALTAATSSPSYMLIWVLFASRFMVPSSQDRQSLGGSSPSLLHRSAFTTGANVLCRWLAQICACLLRPDLAKVVAFSGDGFTLALVAPRLDTVVVADELVCPDLCLLVEARSAQLLSLLVEGFVQVVDGGFRPWVWWLDVGI